MKNNLKKIISLLLLAMFISSCAPSDVDLVVYTTDVDAVLDGDIVEVPIKASFTLYSDDEDGDLDRATAIAEKYLSKDSIFSQSSGDWGETLVIETTIPMGTLENLQNYLASNNRVAVIIVEDIGEIELSLNPTEYADALNSELSDINFMLGFELPADSTNFRIISDSRNDVQIDATAVFVSEKPYLYFSKTIKKRGEAEIVFKGTSDSVYNEIYPVVYISYPL
ncbi:hypothetical protein N9505_01115 [Candidatus Thioglobus sp.]|jgi:hypothetical protein|nr:hypothetical protein [Candidatus Thioglobus sp.]